MDSFTVVADKAYSLLCSITAFSPTEDWDRSLYGHLQSLFPDLSAS